VQLAQGREAEVFLEPDGSVLKLLRNPAWGDRVHREASALDALRRHGHLAPRAMRTVTVDGRPGLVMERVEGGDLMSLLGRRPLSVFRAGTAMGEVHAAMHECEAPDDLPDLRDEVRRRICSADALPDDLRKRALGILGALPGGERLCHCDLHLGNILGTWDAPVVIDWGDASRGDPLADVARTHLLHRVGTPPPGSPAAVRALAPIGRRILTAKYMSAYRRRTGDSTDPAALERWEIVWAAARLWEPVPEERRALLRFLKARLPPAAR
jgi:aminoglycoside phosphotransferase (APT) family kinase protein